MKIRPKTKVYSNRVKIRQKTIVYSIRIKIRPKTNMYIINLKIRPKNHCRMKISWCTKVYSFRFNKAKNDSVWYYD